MLSSGCGLRVMGEVALVLEELAAHRRATHELYEILRERDFFEQVPARPPSPPPCALAPAGVRRGRATDADSRREAAESLQAGAGCCSAGRVAACRRAPDGHAGRERAADPRAPVVNTERGAATGGGGGGTSLRGAGDARDH